MKMRDVWARTEFLIVWILSCFGCIYAVSNISELPLEEVMEHLFHVDRYNRNIRPNANAGKSSQIAVGMYLQSLSSISELKMEYSIDIYFRLFWNDPRLSYNHSAEYLTVDAFWKTRIWLPDPYFMNSREEHFHTVTLPNIMLRIYPNGDIFFSQRLSLTLSCNMDLRKFPMDTQVCEIRIMSYAFNTKDIVLVWQGVSMDDKVQLPEYQVSKDIEMGDCSKTFISGTNSCLLGKLTLTRRLSFYMVQTYVPSSLIVVLSWVNFWLDAHATPARVSLGLLCVLTMTTQNSGILSTLPRVSYIKSIDVWSSACLVFVFGALLEFALVNVQSRKQEIYEKKNALRVVASHANGNGVAVIGDHPPITKKKIQPISRILVTAERVDVISRIVFPGAFIIFNLIYWNYYLN